jgi:hypothetical protein
MPGVYVRVAFIAVSPEKSACFNVRYSYIMTFRKASTLSGGIRLDRVRRKTANRRNWGVTQRSAKRHEPKLMTWGNLPQQRAAVREERKP